MVEIDVKENLTVPLIPLEIPAPKGSRGNIPSNLARKIGPMFGVVSERAPFNRTWICDYDKTTLKEMGRGAPALGERAVHDLGQEKEITAATLNRFDPDTKAAVMLTASNVLFADMTADMTAALRTLVRTNPALSSSVLIMAWAAGCLTAFRSYPLLMVSSLKARSIQRSMLARWNVAIPKAWTNQTPSEFTGVSNALSSALAPRDFELLDSTLELLSGLLTERRLLRAGRGPAGNFSASHGREATVDDLDSKLDSVAGTMSRLLRRVGGDGEGEPAILWAVENSPGNRTIDVFMPPLRLLTTFMAQQSGSPLVSVASLQTPASVDYVVPVIPRTDQIDSLSVGGQRILISILCAVTRALRERAHFNEESLIGVAALEALQAIAKLATANLEESDPVRLDAVVGAQTALIRDHIRRVAPIDVTDLVDSLDILRSALVEGRMDSGIGLEILDRGCLALKRARDHLPPKSLVDPAAVAWRLEQYWATFENLLISAAQMGVGASAAGYHLHDYAGYLASLADSPSSLYKSRTYFRDYVIPSRIVAADASGRSQSLRTSYQVAARASVGLAHAEFAQGNIQAAKSLAAEARTFAISALHTNDAIQLLSETEPPRETTYLFALEVIPAVAVAAALGVDPMAAKDETRVQRLLARAEEWVQLLPSRSSGSPGERMGAARRLLEDSLLRAASSASLPTAPGAN